MGKKNRSRDKRKQRARVVQKQANIRRNQPRKRNYALPKFRKPISMRLLTEEEIEARKARGMHAEVKK